MEISITRLYLFLWARCDSKEKAIIISCRYLLSLSFPLNVLVSLSLSLLPPCTIPSFLSLHLSPPLSTLFSYISYIPLHIVLSYSNQGGGGGEVDSGPYSNFLPPHSTSKTKNLSWTSLSTHNNFLTFNDNIIFKKKIHHYALFFFLYCQRFLFSLLFYLTLPGILDHHISQVPLNNFLLKRSLPREEKKIFRKWRILPIFLKIQAFRRFILARLPKIYPLGMKSQFFYWIW